jgi:chromosome partitioning protein
MFITVASYKGGVGKTTTAFHLAAYLQGLAPTLLIDGDPNRQATGWAKRGGVPFKIVDENEGAYEARNYQHVVIDTEARKCRFCGAREGLRFAGYPGCTAYPRHRRLAIDA